jgi:hypothetical protein
MYTFSCERFQNTAIGPNIQGITMAGQQYSILDNADGRAGDEVKRQAMASGGRAASG